MRDPKALILFQEILKKTEAGKLSWQPTAEEDTFVAPMLGKYTLTLLPYTTVNQLGEHQGSPSIKVDEAANTIVEIHNDIEGITEEELKALLVFARRTALNADQKIDELLEELQKPHLIIVSARYGAPGGWRDVTSRLRTKIRDDKLNLRVSNAELGPDPLLNVPKRLELTYSFGDQTESKTVPEEGMLSIP